MPRRDGTGPAGKGPMTGWGDGMCAVGADIPAAQVDGNAVSSETVVTPAAEPVPGRGRGAGFGPGRGMGRGMGRGPGRGLGRGCGRGLGRGRGNGRFGGQGGQS